MPRFSFHYVAYTTLIFIVVFSVVRLVSATTPNPGHPWIEIGDGVFTITNNQTAVRAYTFPDANATVLTTNDTVTVAQGGTGTTTFATNSILYGNGTGAISSLAVNAGGVACLTQAGSGAPTWGACGGSSITDGDKGDITVTGTGATWTIDSLSITNAKINDVAWSKISGTPTTLVGYGITDAEAPLTFSGPLSRVGNTISIPSGSSGSNGYLTSSDWNIFNGKQPLLSGTGFVKSTGGVISYDTNTYLTSAVTSVSGTTNRITSTGGNTPILDISASYAGQSSITTLGTITSGVWNGTAIANANLVNSSVTIGSTSLSLGATASSLTGLTSVSATTFIGALTGTASGNEVPLTFSTGLTRTTDTITNTLSTGMSGGQSVIGGTASGDDLILSSTSNISKGNLFFGTASTYDEANDRFGISELTPLAKLHVNRDAIATTQDISYGAYLSNSTAATSGVAVQYSPATTYRGTTWLTTSLVSSTLDYQMFTRPTGGTVAARGGFVIQQSLNGGAFSDTFEVGQTITNSADYQIKIGGNNVLGFGSATTQYFGGSSGYSFNNSSGSVSFGTLSSTGTWALTPSSFSTAATLSTVSLAQTWSNSSGIYSALKINITNTNSAANSKILDLRTNAGNVFSVIASTGFHILGTNASNIGIGPAALSTGASDVTGSGIRYVGASSATAGTYIHWFSNVLSKTSTSGTGGLARFTETFAPTSGTAEYNMLTLFPTINQTGVTGTPITRGIYINPTLTAASDFRAIETASADYGNGAAGLVVQIGRNTNATNTGAGSINFLSKAGTNGYVWQDAAGNMRINTAAPSNANDTAGTVIGAQTSTRDTKQDITDYSDYNSALSMIVNAPLHTFRYKKEVEGYGENSPLAKTRIGYIADEVDPAFMVGNVIDQVSVNGIVMASIKELDLKIKGLSSLDISQAGSLGSLIVQFFTDQAILINNLTVSSLHINDEICVDDVCATKEEFKALLLEAKNSHPQIPLTITTVDPSTTVSTTDATSSSENTPTEGIPLEETPVVQIQTPAVEIPAEIVTTTANQAPDTSTISTPVSTDTGIE